MRPPQPLTSFSKCSAGTREHVMHAVLTNGRPDRLGLATVSPRTEICCESALSLAHLFLVQSPHGLSIEPQSFRPPLFLHLCLLLSQCTPAVHPAGRHPPEVQS